MQNNVVIRTMTPADADAKGYVHWKSCLETYTELMDPEVIAGWSPEIYQSIARKYPENTLVAEIDGRIVGFGTWKLSGEIYGLYVLQEFHGLGLGRRLLEEMLSRLSGCEQVWLEVLEGNDQAIGFYEHMGFQLDGSRKITKFSSVHPALGMVHQT